VTAKSKHVAMRLDPETVARVDALLPGLSSAWHTAKRSDALRYLILAGLAAVEAPLPPARKGKPRK
jgi:hypothetical protein